MKWERRWRGKIVEGAGMGKGRRVVRRRGRERETYGRRGPEGERGGEGSEIPC